MPNLDLAKKRVEDEIAKYGGIHIECEPFTARELGPYYDYHVWDLDSDNKPRPTGYDVLQRPEQPKHLWYVARGPFTGMYMEFESDPNRLHWGLFGPNVAFLKAAKSDPMPQVAKVLRRSIRVGSCWYPGEAEGALDWVLENYAHHPNTHAEKFIKQHQHVLNEIRKRSRAGDTRAADQGWREILNQRRPDLKMQELAQLYAHYRLDVPWHRIDTAWGQTGTIFRDDYKVFLDLIAMNEVIELGGVSFDQLRDELAPESWRCRQLREIAKLIARVNTPSQARAIAGRYFKDNKLDVLAKKLLGGMPKAERILPMVLQDNQSSEPPETIVRFFRRANIKDPQWADKAAKLYNTSRTAIDIIAANMWYEYNDMHALFEGIAEEEFVKDVLLKYPRDQFNTLMDTLRGLQDHREALTQPEVVEANPWIHHLYSARQRHEWNRLANTANHDRLMNLIRELQGVAEKYDKIKVAWHANALKFKLLPGITPLETQEKQLARGVSEKHCCGLFTWQQPANLVFAFDDATTGDTATMEVHVPTQRVLQFYGPANSKVTSPKLLEMLAEFMLMNKDVMANIAKSK